VTRVSLNLDADYRVYVELTSTQPTLVIRCQDKVTEIYVNVGMKVQENANHTTSVNLTFDDLSPTRFQGTVSTDGEAIFLSGAQETSFALLHLFRTTRNLDFGFRLAGSIAVETSFNMRGFNNAFFLAEQDCGWESLDWK
jgi:hypothetical protein